mmetsp:Transcript_22626/g.48504  ORF Transcript_22626/g.48504 Transcript_22626/m.48504 type:complete len:346 (+) Transcript_22626:2402-3439(+)
MPPRAKAKAHTRAKAKPQAKPRAAPRARVKTTSGQQDLPLSSSSFPLQLAQERLRALQDDNCGACLMEFEMPDTTDRKARRSSHQIALLDCCSHVFHFGCIETWAKKDTSCPQCKERFRHVGKYGVTGSRVSTRAFEQVTQEAESDDGDDGRPRACETCQLTTREDRMLICDGMYGTCNSTHHTHCVGLKRVPSGEWFCPSCIKDGNNKGPAALVLETVEEGGVVVLTPPASPVRERRSSTLPPWQRSTAAPGSAAQTAVGVPNPSVPQANVVPPQFRAWAAVSASSSAASGETSAAGRTGPPDEGVAARFAKRRRTMESGASFIKLNPKYEDDFLAVHGSADTT